MSDGPHRSLPMRRPWKTVAECADNAAFEVDEIREAIVPALEQDCRREMRREFLDGLCRVVRSGGSLFKSDIGRRWKVLSRTADWAWSAWFSIMQCRRPRMGSERT